MTTVAQDELEASAADAAPDEAANERKDVAGGVVTSVALQLSLLVSGVAGARILGVLDRGHSAMLVLLATAIPALLTFGLPIAVPYWLARDVRLTRPVLAMIKPAIITQVVGIGVIHLTILVALFHGSPGYVQRAAAVSLFAPPAIIVWGYGLVTLQGLREFGALNIARVTYPPLSAAALVILLATGAGTLMLVTISWVSLYWVSAIVTFWLLRKHLRALPHEESSEDVPTLGEMYRFGAKGFLGAASPVQNFQLDQAIVGLFVSTRALGIYVVAVAFTNFPRFIAQSIGLIAFPNTVAATGRTRQILLRYTLMTLVVCGVIIGITEVALPFVVPIMFGPDFKPAIGVARILLVSAMFFALRRVWSDIARGAGQPMLGTVAEVVSLVALFPAVAVFAADGARGVALALLVSTAVSAVWCVVPLLKAGQDAAASRTPAEPLPTTGILEVEPEV